jgi:cytoskeletal protein CcmA (bactofilin family)
MRMFRRREDGSEELITDTNTASEGAKIISAPTAATATAATAASPAIPNPALQATPNFRPIAPQAPVMAPARPAMPSSAQSPSLASDATRTAAIPAARASAKRVLTVGPDIQMKGEISSCDRVVIEGVVDATMRDVHTVELAETGSLKGTAEVEDAEISGSFEGDLIVRGKMTLYASGRVRGNVTYGEIEIQRGGQISGNIRNIADTKADAPAKKHAA